MGPRGEKAASIGGEEEDWAESEPLSRGKKGTWTTWTKGKKKKKLSRPGASNLRREGRGCQTIMEKEGEAPPLKENPFAGDTRGFGLGLLRPSRGLLVRGVHLLTLYRKKAAICAEERQGLWAEGWVSVSTGEGEVSPINFREDLYCWEKKSRHDFVRKKPDLLSGGKKHHVLREKRVTRNLRALLQENNGQLSYLTVPTRKGFGRIWALRARASMTLRLLVALPGAG